MVSKSFIAREIIFGAIFIDIWWFFSGHAAREAKKGDPQLLAKLFFKLPNLGLFSIWFFAQKVK